MCLTEMRNTEMLYKTFIKNWSYKIIIDCKSKEEKNEKKFKKETKEKYN